MAHTDPTTAVKEAVARLGRCVELVACDPNFHEITVGLYLKGQTFTFWTYARIPGVKARIQEIRNRAVRMTGMAPVSGRHDQLRFSCGDAHRRALRFMVSEAVEKPPDRSIADGPISANDNRSRLTFTASPLERDGRWVYRLTAEGDAEASQAQARIRAVVGGFMRYGDCQRFSADTFTFPCGVRHDELARLLIYYARNVSAVEEMMAAQDLAGQMTTQTLGFSQT